MSFWKSDQKNMPMVGFLTHNDSDILRAKTGPYRRIGYQTNILPTSGKSKTKVADGGQWHYAWTKYSMAVLWAYPHQQEELSTYCQLILGQFMAGVNIALNIEFDQATRKFFHGHQDLSFADVSQLAILSNQIFLPREQRSGWAFDSSAAGPSQSTGRRRNKRKRMGSTSESPTCRAFNKASAR